VGEDARGLSPNVVGRLKMQWASEYADWMKCDLSARRYIYWWADGIHTNVREEDDGRSCLLVIIGVTAEGKKELVSIGDGLRESSTSWLEVLRDLKARGLELGPLLAVGDGALGFWAALEQIYPETQMQRCWVHKSANVLNEMPKSVQGKAKAALHEIWMAPTRAKALIAFDAFLKAYQAKYPKATDKLLKDRNSLLAFYDFPAEHWIHLRTTNPVESTFATVRQRTTRTKNCVSRATFLGLAFKLVQEAQKHWRRIRGAERIDELLQGMVFRDGVPAPDNLPERQRLAA
jgi:transposase-like protein